MDPSRPTEYERIALEKIKIQMSEMFNTHLFDETEFTVERAGMDLMIKLRHEILGQHHHQKYLVEVDVPKDWWQHFKYQHLPAWWQHRWPIKWKVVQREIEFDHKILFPESEIKFPSNLGPVVFHSHSDEYRVRPK